MLGTRDLVNSKLFFRQRKLHSCLSRRLTRNLIESGRLLLQWITSLIFSLFGDKKAQGLGHWHRKADNITGCEEKVWPHGKPNKRT